MEFRDFRSEMGKQLWTSPFAPFKLSEDEKKKLHQLAQTIVDTALEEYEEFTFEQDSKLSERDWKFLRRDHQCQTYVRRREEYGLKGFGTTKRFRKESEVSSSANSNKSDEITSLDVVDVRSIGVTNGTKEDAVYGVLNPTTIVMRVKSAYVDDEIQDCNVFNVIQNSTPEDPFTTLSLRWRVTENPPVVNWIIKSYDHVYIDATGHATLSNGEKVTFQLLHSVDFPKATPHLPQFSRGQAAGIAFWRQIDDNLVSIWARGVFTVPMERARGLFEPVIGAAMSKSVMNNFHAAQMKKLRWSLYRRQQELRGSGASQALQRSTSTNSTYSVSGGSDGDSKVCIVCAKKRKVRRGDKCELCRGHVCGPCTISHKVAIIDEANKLRWQSVRVCSFCMAKVVKMDATEAALIEHSAGEFGRIN